MQFDIVANDKASATMGKVDNSLKQFGKGMASSLAEGYAKAQIYLAAVQKLATTITELGNVADEAARMGLTVEQYTKLKYAAEQYGSSIEEIAKAQKDVNKMVNEAASNRNSDAYKTLKTLGFSDQEIVSRQITQIQVFQRLSEAIKGCTNDQEKFAIASLVLGDKISQGLVPVLEDYKRFNQVQGQAVTMSQRQADELDYLGDRWSEFTTFLKQSAGAAIAEASMAIRGTANGGMGRGPSAPEQITPEEKQRRENLAKALLASTKKPEKSTVSGAGEVSSMAAIGGAAFRNIAAPSAKSVEEQQLDTLNQIANNTTPTTPAPAPGATNITNPVEASRGLLGTLKDMFSGPGTLEVNAR